MTQRKRPTAQPPKRGRPRLVIDPEKVSLLARVGCTVDEIASELGCNRATLFRNYATAIKAGAERLRVSLKRQQVKVALTDGHKGQGTMLVWLGKQYLGQRDKSATELTGRDGAPLIPQAIRFGDHEIKF